MLELKRKLLAHVLCKEEEGADGNGRGGANSDGRGGVSDGKGNKDSAGRDGADSDSGNGGNKDSADHDNSSPNDTDNSDAPDVDPDAMQARELSRMARQGLVVDTDATGSIVDAKPERAASFGLFGANDLGTGSLRARTPADMAGYGIDLGDLNATDRLNAIDPSRTIASDIQGAATSGLGVVAGPMGSVVGMGLGNAIDSSVTRSRLSDLGYADTQARAIADSAIGARTANRAIGMIGGAAIGPVASAIAGLSNNPIGQLALDAATKKAASYGLSIAGQSLADTFGRDVYGDIMDGKNPYGNPVDTPSREGRITLASGGASAASAPAGTVRTASKQPDADIGSNFYDYVSKYG